MRFLFVIILLSIPITSLSQKVDNIWIMGTIPSIGNPGGYLDFSSGYPLADTLPNMTMPTGMTVANICDSSGALLFYTNGIWVANRNDDTMQNGYGITSGFGANWYNESGTLILQGVLILPHPTNLHQYYIFAVNDDDSILFRPRRLVYSKVDMELDGGLGGITDKNISIIEDTLTNGRITACQHADGKSWWLIAHEHNSNKYYKWLVTGDTILGPYSQNIGSNYGEDVQDIGGQSVFSPDGKKFATFGNNFRLNVMNFDRCTGEFSNNHIFPIPSDALTGYGTGCSFSTNSRFVYFNAQSKLWQLDLDPDIGNFEIDTIDKYNGTYMDPFWTWFGLEMLAPDGKIYLGEWNGNLSMHVINNPDGKGAACDFQQHSYPLPVYNGTVPNFVNYDVKPFPIFNADAGEDKYIYGIDTIQIGITSVDSLTYLWSPSALISDSSIATPLAFPTTTTKYYLTIVDTTELSSCNERIDSMTVFVNEFPLSIEDPVLKDQLLVYPNPSSNYVTIVLSSSLNQFFELTISNSIGETISKTVVPNKTKIDISQFASGLYFVTVKNQSTHITGRFIRE